MKPKSVSNPGPAKEAKKVLYVEDEDENWEVAELLLKKKYQLTRARDAREACAAVQALPDLFAVLMDIQLSGSELDGIQLTRLFRGTLPAENRPSYALSLPVLTIPIIFVTAYGARYSETSLIEAGGNLLVTKPVDFTKLTLGLATASIKSVHLHLATQKRG